MLEFFIALFGGLFYGNKIHNDRRRSKTAEETNRKVIAEMQIDLDRWLKRVVDTQLESELDKLIDDPSNDQRVYDEIKSNLARALPEIKNVDDFRNSICYNPSLIKLLMMSQHGKIPKHEAQYGFRSPSVYDDEEISKWRKVHSIMTRVDRELEKHDIEAMVFSDGAEVGLARFTGNAKPIGNVTSPVGGVYYWWSCRSNIR